MRRELRVNHIGRGQQGLGAGQVRHVGVVFVGEHRVMRQTQLLGTLDFRVPISALDQAAHQAQLVFTADGGDVGDQRQRARLVSLQRQAKALPLRMLLRHQGSQRFKYIQRQLQPVHLFGINCEIDIGDSRQSAQTPDARHQFGHHALVLRIFVARVQGAEFDGNTVI